MAVCNIINNECTKVRIPHSTIAQQKLIFIAKQQYFKELILEPSFEESLHDPRLLYLVMIESLYHEPNKDDDDPSAKVITSIF